MTRDEVIALAKLHSSQAKLPFNGQWIFSSQKEILAFAAAIESRVREADPALRLVADIRFTLGDDGKRMQGELVEYCKELRRDAARYRWLCEKLGETELPALIEKITRDYVADYKPSIDAAIDAAMQTQAPKGA